MNNASSDLHFGFFWFPQLPLWATVVIGLLDVVCILSCVMLIVASDGVWTTFTTFWGWVVLAGVAAAYMHFQAPFLPILPAIIFGALAAPIAIAPLAAIVSSKPSRNGTSASQARSSAPKESSIVEEVKEHIRHSYGARDFIARLENDRYKRQPDHATHMTFSKGESRVIVGVFASQGSDTLWFVAVKPQKGADTVDLIDDGKQLF